MEDDQEYEVNRLKKLLEDSIVQVEKENMAMLRGSAKPQKDFIHPIMKNVKTCPHVKSPLLIKEERSDVSTRDIHSHIHFLKDLESSLLPTYDKTRILIESVKNRYIPCAIPLSPPVRLKRDIPEERMQSIDNVQNHASELLTFNQMHNKSPKESFAMIEKHFPCTPVCDKKQSTFTTPERREFSEAKDTYQNTSFVHKDEAFSSIRNPSRHILSSKKLNDSSIEKVIPKPKPDEHSSSQAVNDDKHGLHLQISLDSCSTKDVINKMLHKIPELINKIETSSNNLAVNTHNSSEHSSCVTKDDHSTFIPTKQPSEQRRKQDKISQTVDSGNFSNMSTFNKNSEKQNQNMSSYVQTDENKEELHIKKDELQHLVKEIVLETLQNVQMRDQIPVKAKSTFTCQKVDSGIQSEVETDIADFGRNFKIDFPGKSILLDEGNNAVIRENFTMSKSVQVDLYPVQIAKSPNFHDKSCNTDNPDYLLQIDEENNVPACAKRSEDGDSISERNSSPVQEPNKIELMLEKIYDHICQKKEVSTTVNDISPSNPILTRDVAVQFNPLHTSTKSTLTSEIKRTDSSCQYDIPVKVPPVQKSTAEASVQTVYVKEPCDDHHLQINACTQCELKNFIDSAAQTELLLNSEHSATNTSVSSTPVSDSMFMDDLLSEGEVSLPWNLRLLSLSGGGLSMNNADSSDTSTKERDYSLSEGEIHPNVIQYFNMHQSNNSEEIDLQQDPTKFLTDSKIQYVSSSDTEKIAGRCNTNSKNLRLNISNSSVSEGELTSNASLSLGEISPGFRVSFPELPVKSENHPSSRSSCSGSKQHYDSFTAASCSQACDISRQPINSHFTESGLHRGHTHEEVDLQNSRTVLQTVDEEVHSIFD